MPDFATWPPHLGEPNEEFHVNASFKFTKMVLTDPEKDLLRRWGTQLKAFEEKEPTSSGEAYEHFMRVLQLYEEESISSTDAYRQFMKLCKHDGARITEKERVWFKYRTMLEEEKRLKKQHEEEQKHSPEREEYIKSRLLP
jgi:uncharacterized protein YifE (UPF0438 family)